MSQIISGEQFLHRKYPQFHQETEVSVVNDYLKQTPPEGAHEKIGHLPADKIGAYLCFLADPNYVNDGIMTGDETSIERQVAARIIAAADVPESYFQLQRRIAREQGHGDIEIDASVKRQMIEAAKADQTYSLANWGEYLGAADYPEWFKHYTWESVVKLGNFDKEKVSFEKRTKSTVAPFPELNPEALAYVYESLLDSFNGSSEAQDNHLQTFLRGGNFSNLYAHAMLHVAMNREVLKTVDGTWKKYDQSNDYKDAVALTKSLAGYGTNWCTATSPHTAAQQLSEGDFYVYYTRDQDGQDSVPRIAIRKEGEHIVEVRGILQNQEMETELLPVLEEKLNEFPDGDRYLQRAADVKQLTELEKRLEADGDASLSNRDIRFLYEFDRPIDTFGIRHDPRPAHLISKRNAAQDLLQLSGENILSLLPLALRSQSFLEAFKNQFENFLVVIDPAVLCEFVRTDSYLGSTSYEILAGNIDKIPAGIIDYTAFAQSMIDNGRIAVLAANIHKFPVGTVNPYKVVQELETNKQYGTIADCMLNFPEDCIDASELLDKLGDNTLGIVNTIDNFLARMEPAVLAEKLIASQREDVIAYSLEKFPSGVVDVEDLTERLIDQNDGFWAIDENCREFLGAVDPISFTRRLLSTPFSHNIYDPPRDPNHIVLNNMKDFIEVLGPAVIVDMLYEQNKHEMIAASLEYFPEDAIHPQKLANDMIADGQYEAVMRTRHHFPEGTVDLHNLVEHAVAAKDYDFITKEIYYLPLDHLDVREFVTEALLSSRYSWRIADEADKFVRPDFTALDIAKLFVKYKQPERVANNFDLFASKTDPKKLTKLLVSSGYADVLKSWTKQYPRLRWYEQAVSGTLGSLRKLTRLIER